MRGTVLDGLGLKAMTMHLKVHRLEILWAEHRVPTPGLPAAVVPKPAGRRRQAARPPGRGRQTSWSSAASPAISEDGDGIGRMERGFHMLVLRIENATYDWDAPGEVPAGAATSYFLLPTSYFLLPTAGGGACGSCSRGAAPSLPTAPPAASSLPPTSYLLPPASYLLLPTSYCPTSVLLPTTHLPPPTSDYLPPPTSYFLGACGSARGDAPS